MFGWYSTKQLNNMKETFCKPYIYYKDIYGNIVQVTEVKNARYKKSNFDDAFRLGELTEFYCSDNKLVDINNSRYYTEDNNTDSESIESF